MIAKETSPAEIDALLRLLDDDTPMVREKVAGRLAAVSGGDLSGWLARHPRDLSAEEHRVLAEMLRAPKRKALVADWTPVRSDAEHPMGWEEFEVRLGVIADFLHDGITPRPPLGVALDQLAEAAAAVGVKDPLALRTFLFATLGFKGNQADYHDPRTSDLAWAIVNRRSNPIGLCIVFMQIARRMGMQVEGVNYPGHFLCRIQQDGFPLIVDCFDGGTVHLQSTLLEQDSDLTRPQRAQLRRSAGPEVILIRVLNNLAASLNTAGRAEDAEVILQLRSALDG